METEGGRIVNELDSVDNQSHVGDYGALRAWTQNPILPSPERLQLHLDQDFPVGLFLSLPKSLRESTKMSYQRNMPMPDFYQTRRYTKSHWGQRKLLMSEIEFLSLVLEDLIEPVLLVYAGAAHGGHILYLTELFPNVTFHLYDPAPFNKVLVDSTRRHDSRVKIFTGQAGWFDEKVAESYQSTGSNYQQGKLLFVSDIRDAPPKSSGPDRFQARQATSRNFMKQAKVEMAMQADWARTMQADASYLKFKLQYPEPGVDAFEQYLNGTIYLQCWAPTPSSEVRLLVTKKQLSPDIFWNIPLVTGMIDYFNVAWRTEDMSGYRLAAMGIKSCFSQAAHQTSSSSSQDSQAVHELSRGDAEAEQTEVAQVPQEEKEEKEEKVTQVSEVMQNEDGVVAEPRHDEQESQNNEQGEETVEKAKADQGSVDDEEMAQLLEAPLDEHFDATLGQVWERFGVPRVGGDCYIETKIWSLYLLNLAKEPVTVDSLRFRIQQASTVLGHTSGSPGFRHNLNFQQPREDEKSLGKAPPKEVLRRIRASSTSSST